MNTKLVCKETQVEETQKRYTYVSVTSKTNLKKKKIDFPLAGNPIFIKNPCLQIAASSVIKCSVLHFDPRR